MQEISTATVQPRCGDERDSFQLRVEAVCRPGTLEQWWRWWWLWTKTGRWRGDWKKDSTFIEAPSTTAVQQGRRYGGGGRRLGGGQWGGRWIGCVGVVMYISICSGEKPFNCAQCDYSCTTTRHLRQHMLRHSEERHSAVSSVTVLTLKLVIWRGISSNKNMHCM